MRSVVSIQLYSLTGQIILDKKTKVFMVKMYLIQPRLHQGATYFKLESMERKIVNKVMRIKV
jgi:hypothetical protein